MRDPLVISTLLVLGLLLAGTVLRGTVGLLRVLFIPASVVGGLLGLALVQAGMRVEAPALAQVGAGVAEVVGVIEGWPGWLIAVVFAGLLIERPGKRLGEAARRAGRQGIVVWILVLGQVFVGLLATAVLVAPFYDVPAVFGQLIETGFAGGHGTAAAMGEVYSAVDFEEGRDLAMLFATVGLLGGVVSGMVFVNIGVRRGWSARGAAADVEAAAGPALRVAPTPAAMARVRGEVIDPLAFQLLILAAAFGVGYLLREGFLIATDAVMRALAADPEAAGYVARLPLFLFTLIGGWLVREGMHLLRLGDLIDAPSMHRLTGLAMELLIVSALVSVRIEAAWDYLAPVTLLLVLGFAWAAVGLLVLAPRLLPKEYWFELGLLNYGMSTATTAQGLLLLRIVDPELDTAAARDYAAAAPLSAPFVGGGVITVAALPLALWQVGYWPVLAALAIAMAGLYMAARRMRLAEDRSQPRADGSVPSG